LCHPERFVILNEVKDLNVGACSKEDLQSTPMLRQPATPRVAEHFISTSVRSLSRVFQARMKIVC